MNATRYTVDFELSTYRGAMARNFYISKRPEGAIESVDNALLLLDLLRHSPSEGVRVQDVAAHLGIAPSSAHRLLSTLVYRGFATRATTRRYLPGPALGRVEDPGSMALPGPVSDILAGLSIDTGETVSLVRRRGVSVEFLASIESRQRLRVGERTGTVLPARLGSGGKALLAALDDRSVRQLYFGHRVQGERVTADELDLLLTELIQIRRSGFAVNLGHTETDVSAFGIVIPRSGGLAPKYAVALSAPAVRTATLISEATVDLVRRACVDLAPLLHSNAIHDQTDGLEVD